MAGLQVSETDFLETDVEQTWETYGMEDGALYVRISYSHFTLNDNSIVDYSAADIFHEEYVVITYDFIVGEE